MADRVGQQFGNYRLLRLLGKGGFAEVYLGEHIHLGTQAAIKLLIAELTSEEVEQFYEEARLIAHLEHDHVVPVLDFGIENTVPYLVMKYAPNGTLRNRHPKGTKVPLSTAVSYIKQIAEALQYAHERKIIHRDIKPQNILLDTKNEIWLSDFGIAAIAHNTASLNTQAYFGTPHYSAPEQIQNKPRPASDQYALGIVVYEWLTGALPFSGDIASVIYQHLSTPPPSLRDKFPSISPEVEQVVMRALEKKPEKRFASVQELADALEACQPEPGKLLFVYHGHSSQISSIGWSPDGQYIASASWDNTVQVWEAMIGRKVFTWVSDSTYGGQATPNVVAWAPNGKQIAVGTEGRGVYIYDTVTGKELSQYGRSFSAYHGGHVEGMAWSLDGRYIASGIDDDWSGSRSTGFNSVDVWEVATQHKVSTCYWSSSHIPAIAIAWSLDGSQIVIVVGDGIYRPEVTVCDATTGQKVLSYRGPSFDENLSNQCQYGGMVS